MKQKKSNWYIAKIVTRNLARLLWALVCYLAVEAWFKVKFMVRDIRAIMAGYKNRADMIQKKLDIRRTHITLEKLCY